MKRKAGHSYEADLTIEFGDAEQAKDFASKRTLAGERVTLDLEDEEVLEMFDQGEPLVCEINYPDAFDKRVQKEIDAAKHVGAEITIVFSWAPNGG